MTNIIEVENKIITLRDQQVILDSDVAELYGVQTKEINQAVRNNPEKFPIGYIWELSTEETQSLRSKILTLKNLGRGQHSKYPPKAFTEKGLYMLATILKSPQAVETTIAIVEAYAKLKELVCETEGAFSGDNANSAARGKLRGAEDVAAARRSVGGRPADGCDAGPEQRDLL